MNWEQFGEDIEGYGEEDTFGKAVALSGVGQIVAAGAPQFRKEENQQAGYLQVIDLSKNRNATSKTIFSGRNRWSVFGNSVAISGNGRIMAAGGLEVVGQEREMAAGGLEVLGQEPLSLGNGYVRVFERDTGGQWNQLGQELEGLDANNHFGAWNGLTLAACSDTTDPEGPPDYVHVFRFNVESSKWEQHGKVLLVEDGFLGYVSRAIRLSLSADGNTLAVGEPHDDSIHGEISGRVHIYHFNEASQQWVQLGNGMLGDGPYDGFGYSVSLSANGDCVAVGAPQLLYEDGTIFDREQHPGYA